MREMHMLPHGVHTYTKVEYSSAARFRPAGKSIYSLYVGDKVAGVRQARAAWFAIFRWSRTRCGEVRDLRCRLFVSRRGMVMAL